MMGSLSRYHKLLLLVSLFGYSALRTQFMPITDIALEPTFDKDVDVQIQILKNLSACESNECVHDGDRHIRPTTENVAAPVTEVAVSEEIKRECSVGLGSLTVSSAPWCRCDDNLPYCYGPLCRWPINGPTSFELGGYCPDCICWFKQARHDVLKGHVMRGFLQRMLPPVELLPSRENRTLHTMMPMSNMYHHISMLSERRGYKVTYIDNSTGVEMDHVWLSFVDCIDPSRAHYTNALNAKHVVIHIIGNITSEYSKKCYVVLLDRLMSTKKKVSLLAMKDLNVLTDTKFTNPNKLLSRTEARRGLVAIIREKGSALLYASAGLVSAFPANNLYVRHLARKEPVETQGQSRIVKKEPWDPHIPNLPSGSLKWKDKTGHTRIKMLPQTKSPNILMIFLPQTSRTQMKIMLSHTYAKLMGLPNTTFIDASTWFSQTEHYDKFGFNHDFEENGYPKKEVTSKDFWLSLKQRGLKIMESSNQCLTTSSNESDFRQKYVLDSEVQPRICESQTYVDPFAASLFMFGNTQQFILNSYASGQGFAVKLTLSIDTDTPNAIASLDVDLAELISDSLIRRNTIIMFASGGGGFSGAYGLTPAIQAERGDPILFVSLPSRLKCGREVGIQKQPLRGLVSITNLLSSVRPVYLCQLMKLNARSLFNPKSEIAQSKLGRCISARALPTDETFFSDNDVTKYSPVTQLNAPCPGSVYGRYQHRAGHAEIYKQWENISAVTNGYLTMTPRCQKQPCKCMPKYWWNERAVDHEINCDEAMNCSTERERAVCQGTCSTFGGLWNSSTRESIRNAWKQYKVKVQVPKNATILVASCGNDTDVHILVSNNTSHGRHDEETKPVLPTKPSILVIELDSVSREGADRWLPDVLRYLRHTQHIQHVHSEFTLHNSVGSSSLANQIAELSGCVLGTSDDKVAPGFVRPETKITRTTSSVELVVNCKDTLVNRTDRWLHHVAKRNGYTTSILEEFCYKDSKFVPQRAFFSEDSVDHTELGELFCAMKVGSSELTLGVWTCFEKGMCELPCIGTKSVQQHSLEFIKQLWQKNKSKPVFAFYNSGVAHSYLHSPWRYERLALFEAALKDFLQYFLSSSEAANTIVLLKSDHGPQEGTQLYDVQAQRDQMQPMLHMLVPKTMPDIAEHLEANSRRLVTAYDMYVTLHGLMSDGADMISAESRVKKEHVPWAYDIAKEIIPPGRTCVDAAIPTDFCACENEHFNIGSNRNESDYYYSPLRSRFGTCNPHGGGFRSSIYYCAGKPELESLDYPLRAMNKTKRRGQ